MSDHESPIGVPLAETKRRLDDLSSKRLQIVNAIRELNVDPYGDNIPEHYLRLKGQLAALEKSIEETREWYLVGVLESLDQTSSRLKENAEKQLRATERLTQSSDRLSTVTDFLLILTAVLAVGGIGSYTLSLAITNGLSGSGASDLTLAIVLVVILIIFAAAWWLRTRRHRQLRAES